MVLLVVIHVLLAHDLRHLRSCAGEGQSLRVADHHQRILDVLPRRCLVFQGIHLVLGALGRTLDGILMNLSLGSGFPRQGLLLMNHKISGCSSTDSLGECPLLIETLVEPVLR